jgi:hypothetical protein
VTAPITEDRLAEIEARANAATPGPWVAGQHGPARFVVTADEGDVTVGAVTREVFEIYDGCAPWRFGDAPIPEALFIAAARTDVPALVAEVRRLTAALAAHARHTDAAVDGVRAMLPAALEIARREGAASMRERAANVCERMVVGGCAWSEEQATAARALLDAAGNVRALPLDAPGGER